MVPKTIWVAKATGKESWKIAAANALNNREVERNVAYVGNSFIYFVSSQAK